MRLWFVGSLGLPVILVCMALLGAGHGVLAGLLLIVWIVLFLRAINKSSLWKGGK